MTYGFGVLATTARFVVHKYGIARSRLFKARGRKVGLHYYTATGEANVQAS
jgi:hypothetical protein